MNKRQTAVLVAAIMIVAWMLLFPPWYSEGSAAFGHKLYRGYRYINAPPPGGARIDYPRYLIPIAVVCFIALLAYLEVQSPKPRRNGTNGPGA